jgi:hypothetical protein
VFAEVKADDVDKRVAHLVDKYPKAVDVLKATAVAVNANVLLLNRFREWHFGKWPVWMCGFDSDTARGINGVIVTASLESSNAIIRFAHRCTLAVFNLTGGGIAVDVGKLPLTLMPSRKKKKRNAVFLTCGALPDEIREIPGWTLACVATVEELMIKVKAVCDCAKP